METLGITCIPLKIFGNNQVPSLVMKGGFRVTPDFLVGQGNRDKAKFEHTTKAG